MGIADAFNVVASALVSVIGGGAIILALSSWLGKVWANRILEQDRQKYSKELEQIRSQYRHEVEEKLQLLRDRIERQQFVHKTQFETEFKAYRALWKRVVLAQSAALTLRPIMDNTGGKSREQLKKERLELLDEAFRSFRSCYLSYRPFLAPNVYAAATDLADAIFVEGIDFQHSEFPRDENYWKAAQENAKKIKDHGDNVCAAISNRIGILNQLGLVAEASPTP